MPEEKFNAWITILRTKPMCQIKRQLYTFGRNPQYCALGAYLVATGERKIWLHLEELSSQLEDYVITLNDIKGYSFSKIADILVSNRKRAIQKYTKRHPSK